MKERLLQLLEQLGLTPTQFSNIVGIQRSTLQHIIGGRNEISLKVVMAIHDAYPDFNSDWLLYGEGQPFNTQTPVSNMENSAYPLFSQVENQENQPDVKTENEFSNLTEEKKSEKVTETVDNKPVEPYIPPVGNIRQKSVKEIIVFYDDGTFETFWSK